MKRDKCATTRKFGQTNSRVATRILTLKTKVGHYKYFLNVLTNDARSVCIVVMCSFGQYYV